MDYFNRLREILVETSYSERRNTWSEDLKQLSQAMEFAVGSIGNLRTDFLNYEDEYFSSSQKTLIMINILIIVMAQVFVFLHWYFNIRHLKKTLIDSRTIFIHIPFPILMRQKLIKKYLWDTNLNKIA